ncbi:hypothetical protein ABW21_db0201949 [Orbilia brochopaga]|nr:hypothetical protein ABW21_db0201949 [Drechslerella brochopaga]
MASRHMEFSIATSTVPTDARTSGTIDLWRDDRAGEQAGRIQQRGKGRVAGGAQDGAEDMWEISDAGGGRTEALLGLRTPNLNLKRDLLCSILIPTSSPSTLPRSKADVNHRGPFHIILPTPGHVSIILAFNVNATIRSPTA